MPRPKKPRFVSGYPTLTAFIPQGVPISGEVLLSVEELEAVRLSDFEGLDQAAAAELMGVSRQTYGRVLGRAIAELYQQPKEDPARYPRGLTGRILLGNPPKFALLPTLNSQISALIADLRAAGLTELKNEEIGWNVELARFSGAWPHSHAKILVVDGKPDILPVVFGKGAGKIEDLLGHPPDQLLTLAREHAAGDHLETARTAFLDLRVGRHGIGDGIAPISRCHPLHLARDCC